MLSSYNNSSLSPRLSLYSVLYILFLVLIHPTNQFQIFFLAFLTSLFSFIVHDLVVIRWDRVVVRLSSLFGFYWGCSHSKEVSIHVSSLFRLSFVMRHSFARVGVHSILTFTTLQFLTGIYSVHTSGPFRLTIHP